MYVTAARAQLEISMIQGALHMIAPLHIPPVTYPQTCAFDNQAYDYIIVGGGTAGCVLANRLVEDKKTTVLLIEAGGDQLIETIYPALMLYAKSNDSAWQYSIQDHGDARKTRKPSKDDMSLGKGLGGSSSISYLVYSPGSKYDYNNWSITVNNTIWNWANVFPYLKKSQKLEDPDLTKDDAEFYGKHGNIGLTVIRSVANISAEPFLKAFNESGEPLVPSINGDITLGYTSAIYTIDDNTRQSTVYSYLKQKVNNSNLYIIKNAIVKKVNFDACKNAVGVELYVTTCPNKNVYIRAKKEVILSAGVVNTPKILLLSGVGPKKQLCKHKIHTISDLPVGEGLQNHLGVALIANMTNIITPERPFDPQTFPATVIFGYVTLNKSKKIPDYQSINYINYPRFQMNYCTHIYSFKDYICDNLLKTNVNSQTMFSIINKQTFRSQGTVMLKSNDFRDEPLVYARYYHCKEDLISHAKYVRHFVRVAETKTFKDLGGQFKNPGIPECDTYNAKSLKYWICYVRYMMVSQHQYSSTCQMGKVVDAYLKVYGVQFLRIVDASVMPFPTTGGTLGSTIMIAEKAADMIKKDKNKQKRCCRK